MALRAFDNGNSDAARQFLLDRRCERNHPKRHRTKKRKLRVNAVKRAKARARIAANNRARDAYLQASKAYWSGLSDEHP